MLKRLDYKWIVGIVFVFGLFMDLLDMTITNVALPTLARDFHAGATTIQWVVTGYLLSLAVFIPVSGWAGDRFGTKRIFMFALALFTSSSLACGLAWNIESLIAFRFLQGVGGGMLTPVGTAMLFRVFPPAERAAAAAVLTIPMVVAPASGPVLGGYLVEFHSWRWIFLINVPVGVAGFLFAALFLREQKQVSPGRLDVPGFFLAAAGLGTLMYALAEAGSRGLDDSRVLFFGAVGLALLAAFVLAEMRAPEPMIDIQLFRNRLFSAANSVQLVGQGGLMGALFLLPLLLQAEMGLTPLESGLTTFPQALGVVSMVQVAGRVYGRVGPRRMMMTGMAGAALTTLAFLWVDLETSQWWIRLIMFARGGSFALTLIPLQTATFATMRPDQMGRASAVFNAGRQVAASFGVALLATVLTNRLAHHDAILGSPATRGGALSAFHEAFIVAAALGLLGVLVSLLISDKEAAPSMRRVVLAEEETAPAGAH
ncbi:MAG TPA: MDR family MFS transporter [Dehalococcoidia bacterium]|nr:MDR family MFS transporter [Dehalococcoidia bacterium]